MESKPSVWAASQWSWHTEDRALVHLDTQSGVLFSQKQSRYCSSEGFYSFRSYCRASRVVLNTLGTYTIWVFQCQHLFMVVQYSLRLLI
jgi:hypothetical protein